VVNLTLNKQKIVDEVIKIHKYDCTVMQMGNMHNFILHLKLSVAVLNNNETVDTSKIFRG